MNNKGAQAKLATQPTPDLNWKQEVNQRLAAHRSRRDAGSAEQPAGAAPHYASRRAAQAAARVAARYAHEPSYSHLLAEEARAAVRAAEAASEAALKMHAAAQSVLAGLETAARIAPARDEQDTAAPAAPQAPGTFFDPFLGLERPVPQEDRQVPAEGLEIRWEPDLPVRPSQPPASRARRHSAQIELALEDWEEPAAFGEPMTVEPAQPIPGNLIEFPRELIASRRARPRIAEGPLAAPPGAPGQLSIFEVEPGAISIQPAPAGAPAETAAPGWSKIRLDAELSPEPAAEPVAAARASRIRLAPLGLRIMAAVVDAALIGAAFVAAAFAAAGHLGSQPSMKVMEIGAIATLLILGVFYEGFFLLLAGLTPGMRYAGISLCTFDGRKPTRGQLRNRGAAVLLSLLPVGLGILWAIFDEDHLSWHDRISHTCQRCG